MTRVGAAALAVLAVASLAPSSLAPAVRQPQRERAVPFAVGESLTYDVSWSTFLTAGTAVSTVKEKKPSFNSTAYYIVAEGRTTPLLSRLYPVYYKIDTLLDSSTLLPQRGTFYSEEARRHRLRTTQFDRAASKVFFEYQSDTTVKDSFAMPPLTQDALSAIYALRAAAIKTGDRIAIPVSDDGLIYTVQGDVDAPERVAAPIGALSAWKVRLTVVDAKHQPVGSNIAIWLSDDARRLPMKLQADLPVGNFNLLLREVR
jgi:hypothetical protein